METLNGTDFRALIDGEKIPYERSLSFEVDDIRVRSLYLKEADAFEYWKGRRGEEMNLAVTNTNVYMKVILSRVILIHEADSLVEIELRFTPI
jgi:hypothetical protein